MWRNLLALLSSPLLTCALVHEYFHALLDIDVARMGNSVAAGSATGVAAQSTGSETLTQRLMKLTLRRDYIDLAASRNGDGQFVEHLTQLLVWSQPYIDRAQFTLPKAYAAIQQQAIDQLTSTGQKLSRTARVVVCWRSRLGQHCEQCTAWQRHGQDGVPRREVGHLALAWSRAVLKAHQPSDQPDSPADVSARQGRQETLAKIAALLASMWIKLLVFLKEPREAGKPGDALDVAQFELRALGGSLVVSKLDGSSEILA